MWRRRCGMTPCSPNTASGGGTREDELEFPQNARAVVSRNVAAVGKNRYKDLKSG